MKTLLNSLLITALLIVSVVKGPELHYRWLRNKVGSKTVRITNEKGTSGGTGFYINSQKGKTYILTNDHVCGLQDNKGIVYISGAGEYLKPHKVLVRSNWTDLCLVEATPGINGLTLGSIPSFGQWIYVFGHPLLMDMTGSKGEVIQAHYVDVMDHVLNPKDPKDTCDAPKNIKSVVDFFIFKIPVCLDHIFAFQTNAVILPGNSGSAMVDAWGRVAGIMFAGDSDVHWGLAVPVQDIKEFVKSFEK